MSREEQSLPILVINLDRDRERLAGIEAGLLALDKDYVRVRAVDGRAKASLIKRVIDRQMYSSRSGRALTNGEIGCLLSHLSALRRIIRRRLPLALILEDDAEWDGRFADFLAADIARFMQCCDVLKVESMRFAHEKQRGAVLTKGKSSELIVPIDPGFGSAAYLVTAEGARRLAAALGRFEEPVDAVLAHHERFYIVLAETRPPLVRQGQYQTNLEPERWAAANPRPGLPSISRRARNWLCRYSRRGLLTVRGFLRARRASKSFGTTF